ncbi:MAG: nuclear transport factor 2 family protein [Rhodospirillaceae bacterium]
MTEQERNKKGVLDYFDALDRNDIEALLDIFANDGVIEVMGDTLVSGTFTKDQIAELASSVLNTFPKGLKYEVETIIADGDYVAAEARSKGIMSSGQLYENQYHYLMRWRDGKLVHAKEYADTERVTEILCGGQRPAQATRKN